LRIRILNEDTEEEQWVTVDYILIARKRKEPGAAARAQQRRSAVLQRVLYLVSRSTIAASHIGVKVTMGGRILLAFPRLLLYICDIPEEKAILCLKKGKTQRPCSMCRVTVATAGAPMALNANERDGQRDLEDKVEEAGLLLRQEHASRRLLIEKKHSAHSRMPALAGMAGLSTAPFLMYKMLGIDALHVSFQSASLSAVCFFTATEVHGLVLGRSDCVLYITETGAGSLLGFVPLVAGAWTYLPVPQVLDLGVAQMLVHRLVRVFPYACKEHDPDLATKAASRVVNRRIEEMGKRSKASLTAPGYVRATSYVVPCVSDPLLHSILSCPLLVSVTHLSSLL